MADATEGRLAEWTPSQRHEFNVLRAQNYKITEAAKRLKENHEDLHEYAYTTLASYTKSVQGKEEFGRALDQVRDEAKDKSFTHRGSRLDTLIEVAGRLLTTFRTAKAVGEMTKLSGELRDTLKEIRIEVDPLGLETAAVASHFDKILLGYNALDKKKQQMIAGEGPWKDQISETEIN